MGGAFANGQGIIYSIIDRSHGQTKFSGTNQCIEFMDKDGVQLNLQM